MPLRGRRPCDTPAAPIPTLLLLLRGLAVIHFLGCVIHLATGASELSQPTMNKNLGRALYTEGRRSNVSRQIDKGTGGRGQKNSCPIGPLIEERRRRKKPIVNVSIKRFLAFPAKFGITTILRYYRQGPLFIYSPIVSHISFSERRDLRITIYAHTFPFTSPFIWTLAERARASLDRLAKHLSIPRSSDVVSPFFLSRDVESGERSLMSNENCLNNLIHHQQHNTTSR